MLEEWIVNFLRDSYCSESSPWKLEPRFRFKQVFQFTFNKHMHIASAAADFRSQLNIPIFLFNH